VGSDSWSFRGALESAIGPQYKVGGHVLAEILMHSGIIRLCREIADSRKARLVRPMGEEAQEFVFACTLVVEVQILATKIGHLAC
jgi:hypothetical protein